MPPRGSLRGSVTDAGRGLPVPGAAVLIHDSSSLPIELLSTGADGNFAWDEAVPAGYVLTVSADGYVTALFGAVVRAGETARVDARLWPSSCAVQGRIVDAAAGLPLARAAVTVSSLAARASGVTGPDGRFTLGGLPPGSYRLLATADGCGHACRGAVLAGGRITHVALALPPEACRVTGVVRDAATRSPVPGASVQVYAEGGQRLAAVTAGADGHYRTPPLGPGRYSLVGTAGGLGHDVLGAALKPGEAAAADLELLPLCGGLTGTIVDGDNGAPVAGAAVRILDSLGAQVAEVRTDGQGAYGVSHLSPDTYCLIACAAGYQTCWCGAAVAAGETCEAEIALQPGAGTIRARITDPAGNPLPGAIVQAISQDEVVLAEALTDAEGECVLAGLAAGYYGIIAATPGFAAGWMGAAVVARTEIPVEIALAAKAGALSGAVTVPEGKPAAAAISVFTAKGLRVAAQLTDARGGFEIEGLGAGGYFILARAPGFAAAVEEVMISARGTARVQISLDAPGATLAGRITRAGRPVCGAAVRAVDGMGRLLGMALSGARGDYILHDLPGGTLAAVVSGPDLVAAAHAAHMRAGDETVLDVEAEGDPCHVLQRISDARGEPAAGVQVRVHDAATGYRLFTVLTNSEGFFWLRAWSCADPSPSPWIWQ